MVRTEQRAEALVDGLAASLRSIPDALARGTRRELRAIEREAERVARGDGAGPGSSARRRGTGDSDSITWGWYLGLGGMAAMQVVEWPVALLLAGTHAIERHSHDRMLDQLAAGADEGL